MFVPGQLVVCVDDSEWRRPCWNDEHTPTKGTVYTVRDAVLAWGGTKVGEQHIHLIEVVNEAKKYASGFGEPWWWHGFFRPIDDSRLDVFRKALTDAPQDEELVE
jgi:hypothetical protein